MLGTPIPTIGSKEKLFHLCLHWTFLICLHRQERCQTRKMPLCSCQTKVDLLIQGITEQWVCRWVGAYHKMFPLKLSNVGQAFQHEDSKNTTLIWINCTCFTHVKIVQLGLYGLYILQLFLATQMLLIHHFSTPFIVISSSCLCFTYVCEI